MIGLGEHLTYDSATGALAYHADGVGGNAGITFATLDTVTYPAALGPNFLIVA
jgi:Ca2+-binding RTX toxin-like protein